LLQRNIEYLQQFGIHDIIVNVHHFAGQIENAIQSNNGWGSNVIISDERNEVLETGGGLLKAKSLFKTGQKFITCNVDILTNLDISKLIAFHEKNKALITFGVTDRKTSRYLLVDDNNRLCGWRNTKTGEERPPGIFSKSEHQDSPKEEKVKTPLIQKAYSCVVVFEYDIFRLMEEHNFSGKFSLIDVYLKLAATNRIMGFDHSDDKLVDVGKPESVAIAASLFL
jgi:NDP-sugar pyrophosphorylase family protein